MYTCIYTLFIVPSFRAQQFSHSYPFGSSCEAINVKSENNAKRKNRIEGTPEYEARQAENVRRKLNKYGTLVDVKLEQDEAESRQPSTKSEGQGEGEGGCQERAQGMVGRAVAKAYIRGEGWEFLRKEKQGGKERADVRASLRTKEGICTI